MNSHLCRALSEGLSDHLPPAALAALQCTSAELNATIRDCELWRKLTVRRSTCAELYRHGCHFIDSKGVQQVYVDEVELDLDFIASLMSLQAATSRQLRFTGRVERVALGRIALYDPATSHRDFADFDDLAEATLNVVTGSFTSENFKALEFVGSHFPDALVVVEGFCSPTKDPIEVDAHASTSLFAVLRAIDAILHTCGLKRVRVGSYSNVAEYSYGHDWSLVPHMEPCEEQQRPDEAEHTVYTCSSGRCKQVEGAALSEGQGGRHFEASVGSLTETVEVWFDHAWHAWTVGAGGGPPNLLHA